MVDERKKPTVKATVTLIAAVVMLFFAVPAYFRYQKRAEANNQVQINEIRIKQQEQLIQVEKMEAQIRIEEAKGIAESQAIINASLTNQYLQYLAIKAQETMAASPNHTQIYIPVGTNGIPLIKAID